LQGGPNHGLVLALVAPVVLDLLIGHHQNHKHGNGEGNDPGQDGGVLHG
jgi:hypothetical protein